MARRRTLLLAASLAALGAVLGGCSTRTNVSATGNSPSTYTHVYFTAQAVWFNSSATAGPDDGGWVKFTPSTPVTIDLVADSGGNFANLAKDLKLPPGSYSQVRLIPVDASMSGSLTTPRLAVSAQTLGAKYNMEVDCDAGGVTYQLPLELLNPDKGLGIQTSLNVPVGNIGAAFGALSSTSSTTPMATAGTTLTGTTGTPTTSAQNTTAEFALAFDGARDLTAFSSTGIPAVCGGIGGVMLSSHVSAYDLSRSGGIQGQLTLTNLTLPQSANGTTGLGVSAEVLSADGSRHFVVARAPVASDGTFTLYPLAASSSNNTSYDIVIHGPGIATIIIKNILIPATGSSGVSTTGTSTTGAASNPDTSPVTPSNLVSVGTLIPRAAKSTYTTNIATAAGAPLPAGAEVDFYQTLPSAGEVPYVIEAAPIDPFNQMLADPQSLSADTLDSGTYVSTGATITVVSAAPAEKAGNYQVAASAPFYADGLLGTTVAAPTTAGVTTATAPTVGTLALAAGSIAASVSATVTPASTSYAHGELLLSQNGQLIATAPLDAALAAGGGTVQLNGVPGGTPTSIYYLSVREWAANGTVVREWYPNPVDLRSGTTASVLLTID